jgi:hypothetical protein
MSTKQLIFEDSIDNEKLGDVISFRTDPSNIFDPESCIDDDGKFVRPHGIKKAYLIFLLENRKLQKFELESTRIEDEIFGEHKPNDKTSLKRYPITSVTTLMDLDTPSGLGLFKACCMSRFVQGTPNAFARPYFRIEVPELRAQHEVAMLDDLQEAINYVSDLTEEQLDDLSIILNITGFIGKTTYEKKAYMRKLCTSNAALIVEAKNNESAVTIISIKKAIDKGIISNKNGVFRFGDYTLGTTIEQVVVWTSQNSELFELIKDTLNHTPAAKKGRKITKI